MSTLFVAFEDFILSREAMLCTPQTIDFYRRMLKPFLTLANGSPPTNHMVREFLSTVAQRGVSSATVHAHARAVRAFLRFAYEEDWVEEPVTVRMPRLEQKQMEVLNRDDVRQVLSVCSTRDRALVLTLIDSGLRRGEALALDWDYIDLRTGMVHVRRGKGGKARVTYIGAKTRRALLRWSLTQARAVSRERDIEVQDAANIGERKSRSFQRGWGGGHRSSAIFPLTPSGATSLMARLSRKSGVDITFHKCRRTFATWALNVGMDLFNLQRLLDYASLEMVRRYVKQSDRDLKVAHDRVRPIDNTL